MARRKLLLADDSVTIQKVVNLTFADEGIDVVTVGDGDSAMEKIVENLPDVVLADVNMPGLTGYQICEILRENEATRHVPVILLVGSFEPFDEGEAARVGANAYLTKPFQSIRQLVAQVSELMESAASTNGDEREAESHVASTPNESSGTGFEAAATEQLEAIPLAEGPEAEDIDNLYEQSIAAKGNDLSDLADVGIDDEMIETSYTTEDTNSDFVTFEIERRHDVPAPDDTNANMYGASDESHFTESADEAASFQSAQADEPPEDVSQPLPTISYENWQPADMRDEVSAESSDASDPQLGEDDSRSQPTISYENWVPADMRDGETAELPATPDPHISVEENAINTPVSFAEPIPESAPVGNETIRMDTRFDTTGSGTFQFDEIDLLDLPSVSEGKTIEITTPLNAIEQGSNQQVVSLAPELIEMIAQRVVEKLSEKY